MFLPTEEFRVCTLPRNYIWYQEYTICLLRERIGGQSSLQNAYREASVHGCGESQGGKGIRDHSKLVDWGV